MSLKIPDDAPWCGPLASAEKPLPPPLRLVPAKRGGFVVYEEIATVTGTPRSEAIFAGSLPAVLEFLASVYNGPEEGAVRYSYQGGYGHVPHRDIDEIIARMREGALGQKTPKKAK